MVQTKVREWLMYLSVSINSEYNIQGADQGKGVVNVPEWVNILRLSRMFMVQIKVWEWSTYPSVSPN